MDPDQLRRVADRGAGVLRQRFGNLNLAEETTPFGNELLATHRRVHDEMVALTEADQT